MFLLKIIIWLFKPSSERLRRKSEGGFVGFQVGVYHFFLRQLLKTYSHYAISDTVTVGEDCEIVHEFRDVKFEEELRRNGMKVCSYLRDGSFPSQTKKKRRKILFRYFCFKDTLRVCVAGNELLVEHDAFHTIGGNADAKVEISTSEDIIHRGRVKMNAPVPAFPSKNKEQKSGSSGPSEKAGEGNRHPGNLFGKDKGRKAQADEKTDDEPKFDTRKGFDIDTSF